MTKLDICNSALMRCGSEAILSLDDSSKRAVIVKNQYEITLREILNDSLWNFATGRIEISEDAEVPLFGYIARYQLPADCIRVIELENKVPYKVEGKYIQCDIQESIKIKYIKFIEDPSLFSASFIKALCLKLAEDISFVLVQSSTLQQAISADADRYLRKARSYNAQEGVPESRYPEDFVLGARV